MLISEDYRRLNADLHATNPEYGTNAQHAVNRVLDVAERYSVLSILDYGSGKGMLKRALPDYDIREYDPAFPDKAATPAPANMVFCGDVLEHIEPEYLDAVLDDIRRCTLHCTLLIISLAPSKKTLADGRNAHLIVEPPSWWMPRLCSRWQLNFACRDRKGNSMMFVGDV